MDGPPERDLRILRVAGDVYPESMGGGALHVHELSKAQAELGHDVTVLTSDHGTREGEEMRDGYRLLRDRQLFALFGNSITPGTTLRLRRLVDAFDVVHAHSHLYFSSNVAAAIRALDRRLGDEETPMVLTNHGLVSQTAPGFVQRVYLPTVGRATFNAADRVLCYTDTDEQRLRERGIRAPISVIHNGVDCETFSPAAGEREGGRIAYVGRLKASKGVDRAIRALGQLEGVEATMTVVGDGPMRGELERLCEDEGVSERVTFAGEISNDAVPAVYASSDAFVLPSAAEGLPRTVLEALACETPVVTSALPQLEAVVEGAGMQVPRDDVEGIAGALEELLSSPGRRRELGRRGRERVLEDYSWKHTVERTTAVYGELLAP